MKIGFFLSFSKKENRSGEGYFQVEPSILLPNGKRIDVNSVICQSVLSKCLGTLSQWFSRLEVTSQSGYNFIHLTPIQRLYDVSKSSYAITDHHQLNPSFQGSFDDLKTLLDQMRKEWNVLFITDLVYNHAANDCRLFIDYPDASYNLINSPHLKPAVLLDSILIQLSKDISEGKLRHKGIHPQLEEHHLQVRSFFIFILFIDHHWNLVNSSLFVG